MKKMFTFLFFLGAYVSVAQSFSNTTPEYFLASYLTTTTYSCGSVNTDPPQYCYDVPDNWSGTYSYLVNEDCTSTTISDIIGLGLYDANAVNPVIVIEFCDSSGAMQNNGTVAFAYGEQQFTLTGLLQEE